MSTRIFLVRHGATILTAEDRFAGATDVPLSDEGREQAQRLAMRLSGEPIAGVYASPLGRALETAQILARPHGLVVQMRDGLR
ncbi:MAG TPA: histidine phosphatase family protein, partial [Rhodothermales bacterium]|nr:histidine phosphatase family protein [Rhodothermales bacterium]